MSESKIQIKVGNVEFSGEGEQKWLAEQLDKILEKVPELMKIKMANPEKPNGEQGNGHGSGTGIITGLSLINIAGKLSCKSGGDLVIASAAFMHFVEGRATFSRDDISNTMKKATGFYKDTFLGNLTASLTRLEANSELTKSSNMYALSANKVSELNAALSN